MPVPHRRESVRVTRRRFEQVIECLRVVPEEVSVPDTNAAALDDQDTSRFQWFDRRLDCLGAARYTHVRAA